MKKSINLTMDRELIAYLKHNRKNISSYVSNLILNDVVKTDKKSNNAEAVDVLSSNLSRPIKQLF